MYWCAPSFRYLLLVVPGHVFPQFSLSFINFLTCSVIDSPSSSRSSLFPNPQSEAEKIETMPSSRGSSASDRQVRTSPRKTHQHHHTGDKSSSNGSLKEHKEDADDMQQHENASGILGKRGSTSSTTGGAGIAVIDGANYVKRIRTLSVNAGGKTCTTVYGGNVDSCGSSRCCGRS